ncbi:hypothetical protein BDN70DRAFT_995516 [Pholiota conissans]|uniref:Uncharacterized protein n=1 Tax=Pholiota conissans TaxID=109636 RepID=A0A9P5YVQ2_9AGAR|nr:hypothetical protein BDN70DRAFT_995516 [Pholiota conissans]
MRLSSTLNPQAMNIPVAIFQYAGKKKFLVVSQDYNETVGMVEYAFGIRGQAVSLHTSTLNACNGQSVEIHEKAYPLMWELLDIIDVMIGDEGQAGTPECHSETDEGSLVSYPPSGSESLSTSPSKSTSGDPKREVPRVPERGSLPSNNEDDDEREVARMEEFLSNEEKEAEAVVALGAPKKGKGKSKANDNDNDDVGSHSLLDKTPIATHMPLADPTPNRQKFRPISKPVAPDESVFFSPVKQEPPSTPAPKDLSKSTKNTRPAPLTDATAIDPDMRFGITVECREINQIATFKFRAKHTVSKVLSAACKTWGIEYDRARLFQIQRLEDGKGEVEIQCEADETMGGYYGVDMLYVRLNPAIEENDDLLKFD